MAVFKRESNVMESVKIFSVVGKKKTKKIIKIFSEDEI